MPWELQLHTVLTIPEVLHFAFWLFFPVNSDIEHAEYTGQQQLPIQPCILSVLDTCTFNIPSYTH